MGWYGRKIYLFLLRYLFIQSDLRRDSLEVKGRGGGVEGSEADRARRGEVVD